MAVVTEANKRREALLDMRDRVMQAESERLSGAPIMMWRARGRLVFNA